MTRIAIVNLGAHGHMTATLPVVRALCDAGAEVAYFTTEEFRGPVVAAGARCEAYVSRFGQVPPQEFLARLPTEALEVGSQIETRMAAFAPELVVYDRIALAGRCVARRLGLPAAEFCSVLAENHAFSMRMMFGDASPGVQAVQAMTDDYRRLHGRYGDAVAPLGTFLEHEELNVVFIPREFHYAGETFDERFVFVGPTCSAVPPTRSWSKPHIFVSLGTVFHGDSAFIRLCFAAFGGTEWHVTLAAGTASVDPVPGNFHVEHFAPQIEALAHAEVFVTHGGMNSLMEAMYFGVPVVVLPTTGEQQVNGRRVVELGLGRMLERRTLTPGALAAAVADIAADGETRRSVAAMRTRARAAGGARRGADVVLAHLAAKRSTPGRR